MSDTLLKSLTIPPGVVVDATNYVSEGRYVDCDKIRFRNNRVEKIGGWVRETVQQAEDPANTLFTGVPRKIHSWKDLISVKYFAVGTHLKVEMFSGNKIYDITPVRENVTLTDAITTVSGESEVQITDVNHNTTVGDYIFVVSQTDPVDGITLEGQYVVTEVIDLDNYKIDSGVNASGSTSLDGGDLEIDYLLENGQQSNGNIDGWGGGTWGTPGYTGFGWGLPRSGQGGVFLRQWSLDNWGEDLVACVRGGKIYHWDATAGPASRLAELTNAPEKNNFILVSQPSRFLVAFGSEVYSTSVFDPLIIRWAEQETLNSWDITDTNTAGEYRLPKGNYIIGAIQTRTEILIFTDSDIYSMRYIGGDDIFQFEPLGTNTSSVSQNCFVDVSGVIVWMGVDKFYKYDGVVQVLPTTIDKHIFDQDAPRKLNFSQKEKAYAEINKEFNEIIWLYPQEGSEENDSYIKYNYVLDTWDYGTIDRCVWLDKGVFDKPYAITKEGKLYAHEVGKNADGAPLEAYIRTAYFDIDDGTNFMFVDRVLPDIKLAENSNIKVTLYFKDYPHPQAEEVVKGPYIFSDTQDKISCRGRGRAMAIKYTVDATNSDFEIGKVRIGFKPDGRRG